MAITKRKIGSQEIDWDDELGGAVVKVPDELQPKPPEPDGNEEESAKKTSRKGAKSD